MGMQMTGSNGILTVPSEHLPGLIALILFPVVAWLAVAALRAGSSRGIGPCVSLQRRLDATSISAKVALVAMLVGAAVHAAIVPTHWGDSRFLAILFIADVVGFLAASAWLLVDGRFWRLGALAMLGGTTAGYMFYLLKGWESADPVGLITTSIELAGALVLVMPATNSSSRRLGILAVIPIAGVLVLGAADLAPAAAVSTASTSMPQSRTGMPAMRGATGTSGSAGMAHMAGAATSTTPSMMPMSGSSPNSGTSGAMAPMTGSSSEPSTMPAMSGAASPTDMPSMSSGGTTTGTSTTMPGMGGGSSATLSLATTSPAGPIVWPMSMGAMGPGMQMVTPSCTANPTSGQQSASVALVDQTVSAVSRYKSLVAAKADGYVPITPSGQPEVHYAKPSLINDGNILDPGAIESLVYANTPHGAVLVAAMYLMASNQIGATPPMPGGCLTEWHIHTNLCFSAATGVVVGITHGGACATGSSNHVSQPMLHVWLAPVPGGPLTVDASNAQVLQAAEALPASSPPNPTA
jgi:hypothetical protein